MTQNDSRQEEMVCFTKEVMVSTFNRISQRARGSLKLRVGINVCTCRLCLTNAVVKFLGQPKCMTRAPNHGYYIIFNTFVAVHCMYMDCKMFIQFLEHCIQNDKDIAMTLSSFIL